MTATRNDIEQWFDRCKKDNFTHMIIVCDTYDYSNYPVGVSSKEDIHDKCSEYNGKNMQCIDEVYNLSMPKEEQIKQHRCFNY